MKDYERYILNELLNRYERSAHAVTGPDADGEPETHAGRGVFLYFKREIFPDYWIEESPEHRLEINRAARALASRGLVQLDWAPLGRDHTLARARLNLDQVQAAYALAGKQPRIDKEAALEQVAQKWLSTWQAAWRGAHDEWASRLLADVLAALGSHRPLPLSLSLENPDELDRLGRVLEELSNLEGEEPRRVFSARVLGGSKELDGRLGRLLVKAAQEYYLADSAVEEPAEVWAELGLVEHPQHVLVSGPLVLQHHGHTLDIGGFDPDVGLSTETVRGCSVERLRADSILTVENLTSYYQTALLARGAGGRTLVIYLGGYHNRVRRLLLAKLGDFVHSKQLPVRFFHWGDLDLGGFQIFRHLAVRTGIPLEPWLMDRETYLTHLSAGTRFPIAYRRRLESLLHSPGFGVFHDVLIEMLQHGLRLEQENIRPALPSELTAHG